MPKTLLFCTAIFMVGLALGCAQKPIPTDTDHLVALRLESVNLEADRIDFALYNASLWELPVVARGDYYLGEIVVITDGHASIFMAKDVANALHIASFGYERTPPLAAGECVCWTLPLSDIIRISGEQDSEALWLNQEINRREAFERDPERYRATHRIPANGSPMFTQRERLPMPPTLLEHLQHHPQSIVAIQPVYIFVGTHLNDSPNSTLSFRGRSNWRGIDPGAVE